MASSDVPDKQPLIPRRSQAKDETQVDQCIDSYPHSSEPSGTKVDIAPWPAGKMVSQTTGLWAEPDSAGHRVPCFLKAAPHSPFPVLWPRRLI